MTNTVSIGKVYDAIFQWSLKFFRDHGTGDDLQDLRNFSIPVVGETYDGLLNDIGASVIDQRHVFEAIEAARSMSQTEVMEGNYGGGTAMRCHGCKGGTGTSSRILEGTAKDYTLGVIVQANHGSKPDLRIGNVPVGEILEREEEKARAPVPKEPALPVSGKAAEGSKSNREGLFPREFIVSLSPRKN